MRFELSIRGFFATLLTRIDTGTALFLRQIGTRVAVLLHLLIVWLLLLQGYTKPREYIVTEWPLKQTVGEFWSLVYDQECSAVVVLCQPPPNSVCI